MFFIRCTFRSTSLVNRISRIEGFWVFEERTPLNQVVIINIFGWFLVFGRFIHSLVISLQCFCPFYKHFLLHYKMQMFVVFPPTAAASCASSNTNRCTSSARCISGNFLPEPPPFFLFFFFRLLCTPSTPLLFNIGPLRRAHSLHTFMFSRQTIKGKGNNFRRCPVAEFRLYACRLMCSEWPERLWAGLFVARLVQVSSNDWLWTACLLM